MVEIYCCVINSKVMNHDEFRVDFFLCYHGPRTTAVETDKFELLHQNYLGKSEECWRAILQRKNTTVPYLDESAPLLSSSSTSPTSLEEPGLVTKDLS